MSALPWALPDPSASGPSILCPECNGPVPLRDCRGPITDRYWLCLTCNLCFGRDDPVDVPMRLVYSD